MEHYDTYLADFKDGILYDKMSQLIAKIQYVETGDDIFIRVIEQVMPKMPNEAFLVMKTNNNHHIAFLISLQQDKHHQEISAHTIFLAHRINDTRTKGNSRGDLRVSVEIPVKLEVTFIKTPVQALLKNISAGGIFFLAEDIFSVGMQVMFDLPIEDDTIPMSAKIMNKVPTEKENVWGYGCCFVSLDATSESKIRQFVFQQDYRQRMRAKSKAKRHV